MPEANEAETTAAGGSPRIVHVDDVDWQEVRRQQHGPDPARTASVYEKWLDTEGGFLSLYARWDPGHDGPAPRPQQRPRGLRARGVDDLR